MKSCFKITMGIQLVAVITFGQSQTHTYTGDIVRANCMQAAQIVNRNSRGYVPPAGVNAFAGDRYKPIKTPALRKSILRHCSVNPGTTGFALLDDSGNFFKLDETGNYELISQTSTKDRHLRVTITGSVDHETLNVKAVGQRQTPAK